MKNLFTTLINSIGARIMPMLAKLRLWIKPTFWTVAIFALIRRFFNRLFDVKPRHRKDYYPFIRWLVSKRLAFAVVIVLGVLSILYIIVMSPLAAPDAAGGDSIPTYKYNALPLKFYSGEVRILARDKHIAYAGNVDGGYAAGLGRLFGPNDELIYSGSFENSMYEGSGQLYYPDGSLQYDGEFSKNLFHGQGSYYRTGGTLEYKGGYAAGLRSGLGELYNPGGNKIFTGTFQLDNIVYAEFVGKTAPEVAGMYTGRSATYSSAAEYCVDMREIGAVYSVDSGADTLDEEWRLGVLYVLSDSIWLGGKEYSALPTLQESLGEPEYLGLTWVTLSDAISMNLCAGEEIAPVDIQTREIFEDVFDVTGYDDDRQIYVWMYRFDGLVYTFFCEGGNSRDFFMYSIEQDKS